MGKKLTIQAYDTKANLVRPDQSCDSLAEVKPALQKLLDAKTHNFILIKQGDRTITQYLLNRKKDKWRKSL